MVSIWTKNDITFSAEISTLIANGQLLWDKVTLPTGQQIGFKANFSPVYDKELEVVAWSYSDKAANILYWIFND